MLFLSWIIVVSAEHQFGGCFGYLVEKSVTEDLTRAEKKVRWVVPYILTASFMGISSLGGAESVVRGGVGGGGGKRKTIGVGIFMVPFRARGWKAGGASRSYLRGGKKTMNNSLTFAPVGLF